ncbi:hypothetical protein G5B30_14875 [Sphingobacterium sp. SGG-5]|uniref:hypothetical protein n=1 Tax=Sphingobacterium sp. SGG-5 TaxID=2710881 RepID=UPI0013ECECE4|nr:hypothetical protein [Sphingobacterium sp. SGG-5]NGM63191.1 hypothetical protein [Sphingobacterium sp. SGG-5]
MINLVRYGVVCICCLFCSIGCGDGACNVIPNVTFRTNINRGEHLNVYSPGGWSNASGGVRGLIVYNTGDGLIAYDRCSTVNPEQQNRVEVDGLSIIDPASGAKWLLMDGSPTHIAECSLKRYNVRKDGDSYYVSN